MKNLSKIILHTLKENCGQDNATPTSKKCTAIQLNSSLGVPVIARNSSKFIRHLPPMAEDLCLSSSDGNYIYITFESISYASCKYKVDRILRFKISNLE